MGWTDLLYLIILSFFSGGGGYLLLLEQYHLKLLIYPGVHHAMNCFSL